MSPQQQNSSVMEISMSFNLDKWFLTSYIPYPFIEQDYQIYP